METSTSVIDIAAVLSALGASDETVAAARAAPVARDASTRLSGAQAEILRKMLLAMVADPRQLVERLNLQVEELRAAKHLPEAQQRRLAQLARAIYAPLANRLGMGQLKWELEDLALRYLEPDIYRSVAAALNARRADRERYIQEVCVQLHAELERAGVQAQVTGRVKHIHSIWRKMQRKHVPFDQVFDVRAVRILVDGIADCYAALGVVHGLWPYIESEFDDYIATPKDNAYRSLHTAVYGPGRQPLEVQIRTRQMHEHAELGVAAHWKYKEGGSRDAAYETKIRWLRQLLAPAPPADAADGDFLDSIRNQLFEDRVYALTPKGEMVDLPQGATPLDFAYHVHTDLGHRCRGAKVNGRIVPLTQRLKNGEVVEILTGKALQPNRDWLNAGMGFLASTRSRAKVRSFFRKLDAKPHEPLEAVTPKAATPAKRRKPRPVKPKGVIVEGDHDLPSTLARCCNPEPPARIAGYITLARGVSVHRADCPSLLRMKALRPKRLLKADWEAAK